MHLENTRSATRTGLGLGGLILVSTLFVALVLALLHYFDVEVYLHEVFVWIHGLGTPGLVIYALIHTAVIVLLLPGVFFTIGAGFLFGIVQGTLIMVVATTLGATIAFLIARRWLGNRAQRYLLSHPRIRIISATVADGGWRVILMIRLIPFFPFKLSNYVFGLLEIRLADFVLGTFLGVIPLTVMNVYIGVLAGDLATALAADRFRSPAEWAVYACGLLIAAALLMALGRQAERALRRHNEGSPPDIERLRPERDRRP